MTVLCSLCSMYSSNVITFKVVLASLPVNTLTSHEKKGGTLLCAASVQIQEVVYHEMNFFSLLGLHQYATCLFEEDKQTAINMPIKPSLHNRNG